MRRPSRSDPGLPLTWLFAVLALLCLPACATTGPAQEAEVDPKTKEVDLGYGTVGEDQVVGSVSTLHEGGERGVYYSSWAQLLQDKAPGVVVTESSTGGVRVRVRGASSFLGGTGPLFVIDGMTTESSGILRSINPNHVESVRVLKDAGSTAVYGSRGANGVIIIKTKQGVG